MTHYTLNNRAEFAQLRQIFGWLIDQQAEQPLAPEDVWKNYAQMLLIKVFRHLESIETLFEGVHTTVDDKVYPHYVDHASIAVLARSAFETYMMFHFIFRADSEELCELRYQVWVFVGLKGRQNMHGTVVAREKWQHVLEEDEKRAWQLEQAIRSNRIFAQYPRSVQDKVFKQRDAKMGFIWMDLAETSGFPRKYARDMYKHFCNYAHADLVSVLQMRDAFLAGDHSKLAAGTLSFCAVLMGQVIENYAQLFPRVREALTGDTQALAAIELWRGMLEGIGKLYSK